MLKYMSEDEVVSYLDQCEAETPNLFSSLYPRVYENCGQYHSPKKLSQILNALVGGAVQRGYDILTQGHKLMLPGIRYLMDRRMPLFFIAPQLMEAIKMTDVKEEISWVDYHFPYEHGIFVFPKGSVLHEKEGEVAYAMYSRKMAGTHPQPHQDIPMLKLVSPSFSLHAINPVTATVYDANLTMEMRSTFTPNSFLGIAKGQEMPQLDGPERPDYGFKLDDADGDILNKVSCAVFGALLIMNARPNLVEYEKRIKKVEPRKDKPAKEFWSPNVVGRNYVLKGRTGVSHASPRLHWVRDHVRPKTSQKMGREIWVEPYPRGLGGV